MPNYTFSHGDHEFDAIVTLGTKTTWCKVCGQAEANRIPSFGVIPQVKGFWASEFHWKPDLKANHDEATGYFNEAKAVLEVERQNGLKA